MFLNFFDCFLCIHIFLTKAWRKLFFLTCEIGKKPILLSRFVPCSNFFPSFYHLFSQFPCAGTVSQKGHEFLAFHLNLAQPFLNPVSLLSRTGKISNSHLEKLYSQQTNVDDRSNKILLWTFWDTVPAWDNWKIQTEHWEKLWAWYKAITRITRIGSQSIICKLNISKPL